MNRALWTSIVGIGAAQLLKMPLHIRERGAWSWSDLFRTGGMPSSHAAGVVSLATYLGLKKGFAAELFAVSAMLSFVVMYDAMGIRRHAGLIASEVNELEETVANITKDHPIHVHEKRAQELEERLGHLPEEVLGGALLGALVGALSYATESRSVQIEPVSNGIMSFISKW
ncbi:divergent PAP2 family protein [Paenibacillus sp. YYML68]|uniref:divergent PAP2 family protein n=1 Tax=Paenibacillus sp. YYML68 TaxID=2909250 RepID=UPI002492E0BA|nr:divergent PAP2 family protein [Paenibacillus sp. YYML68]